MNKLRFKKLHPDAVIPHYATDGSAGLDLTATAVVGAEDDRYLEYKTGLAVEIPKGFVGLIFPRSSITKMDMTLKNSVGVIDSDYRGEITFRFQRSTSAIIDSLDILGNAIAGHLDGEDDSYVLGDLAKRVESTVHLNYMPGDRVGQLVILPLPQFEVEEATDLSDTARGEGGYGHTGK